VDADCSTRYFAQIPNLTVLPPEPELSLVFSIIVLFLLILFNALFAATEIAVITLNDNKVRMLAEEGDKTSRRILKYIDGPTHFLSTIQVGITFAGFFASAFAADRFAGPLTKVIDPSGSVQWLGVVSVVLITLLLSYISLVFGELVPKRIAMKKPYQVIRYTLWLLVLVGTLLKPFVYFLTFSTNLILRMIGINPAEHERTVTEEEIRMMINVGRETGTIHETEKEMIENIFELNDTQVSEIMTHRTDLVSLSCDATYKETLDVAVQEKFTRIPVYRDNIDNIIGILHIKDLLTYSHDERLEDFNVEKIIREPLFVPETKTIDEAFREMQTSHAQFAVVIDEYGGTAGIITIEDLLEEIVGNMQDEYDEEEEEIIRQDENTLVVEGRTSLDEIAEALNIRIPDDHDYDTIAGMFIDLLGRIPEEEEQPEVQYENLTMKVLEMSDKRIGKIRIAVSPSLESELDENSDFHERKRDNE
jgi:putative hemolysin